MEGFVGTEMMPEPLKVVLWGVGGVTFLQGAVEGPGEDWNQLVHEGLQPRGRDPVRVSTGPCCPPPLPAGARPYEHMLASAPSSSQPLSSA